MELVILAGWSLLCIPVARLGKIREIGFWGSFVLSFLLSPLVGLLFTLQSKKETHLVVEKAVEEAGNYVEKDKLDKALEVLLKALAESPNSMRLNYQLACVYSLKNMPEESLAHLDKSITLGYLDLPNIQTSPQLKNLRSYEGFKSFKPDSFILKNLGFS